MPLSRRDPDTVLLADHLRATGLSVEVVTWDDPVVDWSQARLTVIRSTWDYHLHRDNFVQWAKSLARVHNPAAVVEWNTDKQYLLDLPVDVPVVPSRVLRDPSARVIEDALAELDWREAVLKPAVGLDGHGVTRVGRGEVTHERRSGTWILQTFVREAAIEGEISVIVIDGRPTHAVLRSPPADDFRAQERLGGRVERIDPPDEFMILARAVVEWVKPTPLYARVDMVRRASEPCLMELELIDPSLFFEQGPEALTTMSDALVGLVAS